MARNEEKALTLFNKWHTFKKDFHSGAANRRPLVAAECMSVSEAEKFRRDLVRDVTKLVSQIQNASLGEYRIREINDEINKKMRTKHYWEIRIRELGGGDYKRGKAQYYEVEGKELPGAPNYKYYGAAKELPGVRELFAELEESAEKKRLHSRNSKSRADLYRLVTPDYYGYRDDDDGELAGPELREEQRRVEAALGEHRAKKHRLAEDMQRSGGVFGREELAQYAVPADEAGEMPMAASAFLAPETPAATAATPDQGEAEWLNQKKNDLVAKFCAQ